MALFRECALLFCAICRAERAFKFYSIFWGVQIPWKWIGFQWFWQGTRWQTWRQFWRRKKWVEIKLSLGKKINRRHLLGLELVLGKSLKTCKCGALFNFAIWP